jgi:Leucine-rich repeat (LRR) protein
MLNTAEVLLAKVESTLLGVLLASCLPFVIVVSGWAAEAPPGQAMAVAEIHKLGCYTIWFDKDGPDGAVIGVCLNDRFLTDAKLLVCLKGLTKLQSLNLSETKITDVGLEYLNVFTKLQSLDLWHTNVTDAGLERLKGMVALQDLYLTGTRVTDAGVKKLQQALPKCHISRRKNDR